MAAKIHAPILVEIDCAVCGGSEMATVATSEEIAAQQAYLLYFHKRRLRKGAPAEALEERACFTQDYATRVARCLTCDLILRDPRPTDRAIATLYAGDTYGRDRLEELFAAQAALYRQKARRLAKWLKPGARVVEVGSFVGGFLAAGQSRGWEMLGVDPGEEVARFARDKGLNVSELTLDRLDLPAESLDCIAIWNTFDQLPDPSPILSAARRLLRPGGILALRVPNGECFAAASQALRLTRHTLLAPVATFILASLAWNNLLAFPYLYGYSIGTLDRLLGNHGFVRRQVWPDTLVILSDRDTVPWAAREERAIKAFLRVLARTQRLFSRRRLSLAPWLDLDYVKPDTTSLELLTGRRKG